MSKSDLRVHVLKIWPEYFEAVVEGRKTFEIRRNDRGFKAGDIVKLNEFCPEKNERLGRHCLVEITYVSDWEQKEGWVVFGIVSAR